MIDHLPEIWSPRIGQRVICRPSPECNQCGTPGSYMCRNNLIGHPPAIYGATGTVATINPCRLEIDDHICEVRMDLPFSWPDRREIFGYTNLAIAELSPIFALGGRIRVRAVEGYCPIRHFGRPGQLGTIVDRTESSTDHVWTVNLDEPESWDRATVDEFCEEEMEPL